jgi:hypothetical protein
MPRQTPPTCADLLQIGLSQEPESKRIVVPRRQMMPVGNLVCMGVTYGIYRGRSGNGSIRLAEPPSRARNLCIRLIVRLEGDSRWER